MGPLCHGVGGEEAPYDRSYHSVPENCFCEAILQSSVDKGARVEMTGGSSSQPCSKSQRAAPGYFLVLAVQIGCIHALNLSKEGSLSIFAFFLYVVFLKIIDSAEPRSHILDIDKVIQIWILSSVILWHCGWLGCMCSGSPASHLCSQETHGSYTSTLLVSCMK